MELNSDGWKFIKYVAEDCYATAVEHGWWDRNRSEDPYYLSAKLMLIVSEVSEALEELRAGTSYSYFSIEHEEGGVKIRQPIPPGDEIRCPPAKPEGLGAELADIVIRVFDLCEFLGIDIAEMIRIKMKYNKARAYRHGGKKL